MSSMFSLFPLIDHGKRSVVSRSCQDKGSGVMAGAGKNDFLGFANFHWHFICDFRRIEVLLIL